MPAIDFPSAPAVNQEYSFEGRTWLWNGTGWEVKSYPAALQLGSATAPSLYFTGDTNTGLYSPGADQVALTTAGAQKFTIDSLDGNAIIENNFPTIRPSLDLPFALTKTLDPRITFTRASSATYVDNAGLIQTASADVPRFDHNPTTGESLGLLVEEQRTNLLLNSATLATQTVTVTAAAHVLSFYGTGTVTLTGASTAGPTVGTGASVRTTLAFTPTAGALTLTVTGAVTNAQLEAGAFATSYIPTTTVTVTRSADVASITGTAFSSWYRQDEGTFFAHGIPGNGAGFIAVDAGTTNRLRLGHTGTVAASLVVIVGNVVQTGVNSATNSFPLNTTGKTAAAFKASDYAISANGTSTVTGSGSIPTVTQATIGFAVGQATYINGTIRRLTYWPQRLSNTTLQALTA